MLPAAITDLRKMYGASGYPVEPVRYSQNMTYFEQLDSVKTTTELQTAELIVQLLETTATELALVGVFFCDGCLSGKLRQTAQ